MYASRAPTFGLLFDTETTGASFVEPSELNHQVISLGLIVFNTRTLELIDELYVEIKYDSILYKWQEAAEVCHGLSREYLEVNGVSREDAAVKIAEFIFKYFGGDKPKIMMAGHNVHFDIRFLHQLLDEFEIEFNEHHVVIDTASIFFPLIGSYKCDDIFHWCGFEDRNAHNSLEDARLTLMALQTYKALFNEALNLL